MSEYDYDSARKEISSKRVKKAEYFKNKERPLKKPNWLKVPLPTGSNYSELKKNLRKKGLWTVCEEASCPNISECWTAKTATMMILGGTCTRACKFCNVDTGNPGGVINLEEIDKASEMVGTMGLNYIVITSVDRDDLLDLGAGHFANVVSRIHQDHPKTIVEVLVPDFDGISNHMDVLGSSNPFVIAQNIETVKRLTHTVRDKRAGYEKSLSCLSYYKKNFPHISTKTSLMVGLGESFDEILECMDDLRKVDVDIVTFGQYLRPTQGHLKVERYYPPQEFEELKSIAYEKGFKFVASGPMVRSSYKAHDYLDHLRAQGIKV